jgi:hypothetical protein
MAVGVVHFSAHVLAAVLAFWFLVLEVGGDGALLRVLSQHGGMLCSVSESCWRCTALLFSTAAAIQ